MKSVQQKEQEKVKECGRPTKSAQVEEVTASLLTEGLETDGQKVCFQENTDSISDIIICKFL